jgi:metal-sulfur cluster biosynthetic enzyme
MTEIDEAQILDALGAVIDPELGLDIVSLGLVYEIVSTPEEVQVVHTLTSPGCPMATHIAMAIVSEVAPLCPGRTVRPVVVFSPRWGLERISEEARFALGL